MVSVISLLEKISEVGKKWVPHPAKFVFAIACIHSSIEKVGIKGFKFMSRNDLLYNRKLANTIASVITVALGTIGLLYKGEKVSVFKALALTGATLLPSILLSYYNSTQMAVKNTWMQDPEGIGRFY